MFKKLTIALIMLSATTSYANFYFKGGVGFNKINDVNFANHDFVGKIKPANTFPLIETGVGYNFLNSIRAEVVIDYYFLFRSKENSTNKNKDEFVINTKTKSNALMFNVYKNIFTIDRFTPFVGGGVGIVNIKESASGYAISSANKRHYEIGNKTKKRNELTYKLTAGLDVKISDSVTGELNYNYFNLGNCKINSIGGSNTIGTRKYQVHNITFGMRVSL